ncbi:hypothetical protein NQ318_005271 [Aromia moschata]|uniref:PHD-type domain-containing protein n=1 Tax=Aromia moschata TaxID=1265417 RepID=A0AAV8Y0V5_9CUCU|nr:hypothetical protein NQ318_005271 [Aromia moschata]
MQQALVAAQELGDEKLSLLQAILDKIEIKTRLLDQDFKKLRGLGGGVDHDTFSGLENNHTEPAIVEHVLRSQAPSTTSTSTVQKKSSTGKKKKRKARQTAQAQKEESPPREEEPAIDPDEPTYCLCDQISYGEMIMCDNDLCPIEWFHFSCVTLTTKPKGKWYCPKCRGDRPNVMKPKAQFLRELEKYNKEKEEKT